MHRKPDDLRRSHVLRVLLTPDERDRLERAAREGGTSMSETARAALRLLPATDITRGETAARVPSTRRGA